MAHELAVVLVLVEVVAVEKKKERRLNVQFRYFSFTFSLHSPLSLLQHTPTMKAKRTTAAMNGIGANTPSSSLKHGIDRDRERDKRRRVADGNVGKEFQTASLHWNQQVVC